ncbi:hypothetical protein INR49_011483 [Caranx melampygus]|nr:hypothetical protein INR49_011483 [Caranx melampygus]
MVEGIQFKGARRRSSSRSCRANAAAQAWAGAADEWQRITDEDTVTRLTLLHSRGGREKGRGVARRGWGVRAAIGGGEGGSGVRSVEDEVG